MPYWRSYHWLTNFMCSVEYSQCALKKTGTSNFRQKIVIYSLRNLAQIYSANTISKYFLQCLQLLANTYFQLITA